jgi:polysaccharide pyruvyl transferase WcaK-like protein
MTAVIGFISALNIQFSYINIIIGGCSLVVSLIKSIFVYLKISQKNENHRVAYLQYYQISNEIRIELSLARNIRQPANYLLNLIKIKMKNLNEVSELIDNEVIETYTKRNQYNILYHQIGHPDILDDIRPIEICKWENDVEKTEKNKENTDEKKEIEEVKENTDENV